ncbi:HAMP domain-containing sensor histidine kinase [Lysinibacillus pakistanensis]|uniref:histidine kinase n=1 Tax=Lysinibacillus pakistanensis TaxID=759811 RepID=A0AAX3WXW7_9BACI|nr:HAMP domain-containing sensor histidine kinase [Lysinibacillus pakistanensis]MDM5230897.1 HAMP domain-containing sensor histidine kinase [Lysinibacillus pakistanensis]WHY46463.1 HAMP domain-containing sensor histidine kinase [Lysinibacillus pakistanensis]WHY51476.1 HAMP domain-containing sensor histidine kinase [Lysinibacillus pakistanensis]
MGRLKYLNRNLKLKTQFLLFFIISAFLAAFLSIILLLISIFLFHDLKQVNEIKDYVELNAENALNQNYQKELKRRIPDDFDYWLFITDDNIPYTSTSNSMPIELSNIIQNRPTKEINIVTDENHIISYIPLHSKNIEGAFILKYKNKLFLNSKFINKIIDKTSYTAFFNLFIILPIMILCTFITAFIFSLLFARGINKPLKELINASETIKHGRLDFAINTSYNNEIGQVLKSFEDMRKTLQDSLKKQWTMEEQRKDMILSLTHNIKTPVTIINGHLELISSYEQSLTSNQKKESMDIIVHNADRIRVMINQLNEIWDLERTNFSLFIQDVSLSKFTKKIKDNFDQICSKENISFKIVSSIHEEDTFSFDPIRMNEVFENIISNSIKFTNNGEIKFEIKKEEAGISFKISDTGNGFNEKELEYIFNKDYKGDEGVKSINSSGLGLYICKLIVEKHNGKIKGFNNGMGGASIEIFLPQSLMHKTKIQTPYTYN